MKTQQLFFLNFIYNHASQPMIKDVYRLNLSRFLTQLSCKYPKS